MLYLTHINADGTYSVKDSFSGELRHFTKDTLPRRFILGVFRDYKLLNFEPIAFHPILADEVSQSLVPIIERIKTLEIREFANAFRRIIPEYFFHAPASTSGKYHPPCDLGEGGLARHTMFVCECFKNITAIASTQILFQFTQEELDCMLVACLFHDFLKDGWYNNANCYKYHAAAAANAFRASYGAINQRYLNLIAHCIMSHMGEWGVPAPSDKYQWLVHLSDYLGSRNNINMSFGNDVYIRGGENLLDVSSEAMQTTMKPKERKGAKLTDENRAIVTRYLTKPVIVDSIKAELGITRTDNEVVDILQTVLKTGSVSEKQEKYVQLAIKCVGFQ